MKNNILKFTIYLYYFFLIVLLSVYMFPGSIIGYLLYGDIGLQPNFIENPIGTSINHFFYFSFLTFLGFIYNFKKKKNLLIVLFFYFFFLFF